MSVWNHSQIFKAARLLEHTEFLHGRTADQSSPWEKLTQCSDALRQNKPVHKDTRYVRHQSPPAAWDGSSMSHISNNPNPTVQKHVQWGSKEMGPLLLFGFPFFQFKYIYISMTISVQSSIVKCKWIWVFGLYSLCFKGTVYPKMLNLLKMYSPAGYPRHRWVCFYIGTDLLKFSITSLAH